MKKFGQYRRRPPVFILAAAVMLACLFLAGCVQATAETPPRGDTEKRHIEKVSYEIPAGWQTTGDGLGGYMHYPGDGGILYVNKTLYTMTDFTDPDVAARVVTLERDRMMSSVENARLIEEEGQLWKGANSLRVWFKGEVDGRDTTFYARVFPYDNYLYSFLFAFPHEEESELINSCVEIEESVFIPIQLREEGE
ncbi:hypothetical protein LJC49_08365 [Ruminococcaceae bacterium OttesenSCG-928-I18]|nr:hypothetical protein [Ruminococcaceae bacterium OttesenSCG-928-I18]